MDENINQQSTIQQPIEQDQTQQGQGQTQANSIVLESMKRSHHTMMIFVLISVALIFGLLIYYLFVSNNESLEPSQAQIQPITDQSTIIEISPSPVSEAETADDANIVDVEMDLLDLNKDLQGL